MLVWYEARLSEIVVRPWHLLDQMLSNIVGNPAISVVAARKGASLDGPNILVLNNKMTAVRINVSHRLAHDK
jgi:hypothetical protein